MAEYKARLNARQQDLAGRNSGEGTDCYWTCATGLEAPETDFIRSCIPA